MAAPPRGNTGYSTYFITSSTFQKNSLFQSERMAQLFIDVRFHYRDQKNYLLHEFVLTPDHFHLLITPTLSLERTLQLIKGGFSYRAKKELEFNGEIWEKGCYDRRVRDIDDFHAFRRYIRENPVKKGLAFVDHEFRYTSARAEFVLDELPPRLKPVEWTA